MPLWPQVSSSSWQDDCENQEHSTWADIDWHLDSTADNIYTPFPAPSQSNTKLTPHPPPSSSEPPSPFSSTALAQAAMLMPTSTSSSFYSSSPPNHIFTDFTIKSIPHHGHGVVALRMFASSSIILSERPIFSALRRSSPNDIENVVGTLDSSTQADLISFQDQFIGRKEEDKTDEGDLYEIFLNNGIPYFAYGDEDQDGHKSDSDAANEVEVMGVFKYISRVNHSCLPNSGWYWCPQRQEMLLVAYRDIPQGKEITACYHSASFLCQTTEERRVQMKTANGFHCMCVVCTRTGAIAEQDDRNRMVLGSLYYRWQRIGLDALIRERDRSIEEFHLAAQLAACCNLVSPLITILVNRFYVQAAYGRYSLAKLAATGALEVLRRLRGTEAAGRHFIAQIAEDPTTWKTYGINADLDDDHHNHRTGYNATRSRTSSTSSHPNSKKKRVKTPGSRRNR